ncbi:MAG: hypothetical protein WCP63_06330 [Cyanobium sp. ELA712]
MQRSRHLSVLQQIFNRQEQAWERLIADEQHLFNIKIKVLMSDDIAKTHGSFPVDMGITILKQSRDHAIQSLQ